VTTPPPTTVTTPPPTSATVAAPPPPPRRLALTPRREWIAGAIVAAVGVAGIAVGAGLYAHVVSLHDQYAGDPLEAARRGFATRAQTEAAASTAMYVVGGVLAAAGAGLVAHGLTRERPRRIAFAPLAGPHEVGVCVEQQF
jgi:hypothetical protein